MNWEQFITIFLTAIITAGASNYFSYIKEHKVRTSKYTERVLTELYVPIFKLILSRTNPHDGFEGLDDDDVTGLVDLFSKNPELFDPELEQIINSYYEISYINWKYDEHENFYECDKKLLNYINGAFHKTRKSLGLPNDYKYSSSIYSIYNKIKTNYRHKRKMKRLKKKMKRKKS
ncbi:hypothetical protein [Halalkalibacter sp. APA_J-10(15)]|uniref:hypothetical protein n=1 Tax=Halalkalibacter sp. APA_J-10(15) TaxID=2933805 RepID=UPI001FF257EE|nr:hypothetical protein [Halalkalibacter sp. APA_J-10(15)]MCK0470399.1 hypothetical protein [Halalkalibacter sp. APA_J-10(15)]